MIVTHLADMRMQSILPILPIVVFEILVVTIKKMMVRRLGVLNQRLMMVMSWYYFFVLSFEDVCQFCTSVWIVEFVLYKKVVVTQMWPSSL